MSVVFVVFVCLLTNYFFSSKNREILLWIFLSLLDQSLNPNQFKSEVEEMFLQMSFSCFGLEIYDIKVHEDT